MNIAIIGPGAIGGTMAAWLGQNPDHAVTVCARSPLDSISLQTPDGTLTATPTVLTDPADAIPLDWVLVTIKTYDIASAQTWLDRLVGPQTRVAVLQNGVEHIQRFAHLLPAERIVPVVVDFPASRLSPGRYAQGLYGSMAVPVGRNGDDFVALFAGCRIAIASDADFQSRAWAKLCLNCAGAVPTLTQRGTGAVWTPELEALIRALVEECAAVARAEGATIAQSVIESVVDAARNAPPTSSNSMQADRLAGRAMEIEARNGVIVRLGARHGIATPMNALMVTLLNASGSPWVQT
ncbi:2-dehydropantoate 2-reductase [Devosia limi DSM 17137]|uniref:2-dehydropantoate 2-reductase n=1 Tax=Devosia limi DSM 17137 TaxID=1121477 RepID=A0A0F5LU56_9HYPH|nr:2-dehydropantoate 2-reductase [Devosia limi]KKB85915.1 2-dehydropantoate 2-reductase [Devosia limi DSM 17137]SHF68782.1 ketopantoate reductase [Devosia limi DSM 17137]